MLVCLLWRNIEMQRKGGMKCVCDHAECGTATQVVQQCSLLANEPRAPVVRVCVCACVCVPSVWEGGCDPLGGLC